MIRNALVLLYLGFVLTLATACKKEVEIQVREVPKTYSWLETPHLTGLARVILSMGKDERALYLQSPTYLGVVAPGSQGQRYFLGYLSNLPADVNVRLPIMPTFLAIPQIDTVVTLLRPTEPISNYSGTTIRLRQLDPRAQSTSYPSSALQQTPFAAISAQNYLLFGFRSRTAANAYVLRLVLAKVSLNSSQYLQAQPRVLDFPGNPTFDGTSYVGTIAAIDDYFLVDCGRNGGYKVRQDGTVSRMYPEAQVAVFYKWQGLVYAHTYRNTLLLSADAGETWRTFANAPGVLSQSDFRVIADSLVGYVRSTHQLYTLRWSSPSTPRIRELKNDGMAQVTLNGLEQLHDTVYAGTTGGLYKRPLKSFFEAAP